MADPGPTRRIGPDVSNLSMPVLPDCAVCGAPVSLEIDGTGAAREVCAGCGNAQKPVPPPLDRSAIRSAVRESRRRRLLGPSCLGRRHTRCTAQLCECTCHDKTKGAPA